ncbi:SRPBCC domain-containing protein [Dyadobacter sp. Leaf189]|uniref:SRPBCC domain-containing protein n=1 Tax=Dyadobacter sp. Leaf189 TaxID=1736295 RepID=UPI000B2B35EB|nr:SRPBCC domain-containing protein [Dyadobacter sp. Leaf189]
MESMKLESKAAIQIAKTPQEVYDAIVDPVHMVNYFIADSSGHIREGARLTWHFPETDVDVPVMIEKVTDHQFISFYWGEEGNETLVEITLEPLGGTTIVRITEKFMENTPEGIDWLRGNTEGWAYFLAFLKAYLEHGVNLRKGAFDWRFQ